MHYIFSKLCNLQVFILLLHKNPIYSKGPYICILKKSWTGFCFPLLIINPYKNLDKTFTFLYNPAIFLRFKLGEITDMFPIENHAQFFYPNNLIKPKFSIFV